MATVMPQSELMRKAVAWVNEQRQAGEQSLPKLLSDAGMRFNLSPNDQEFIKNFFANETPATN